ncbi:MAG: FtsX-like permease family protein [Candidatus Poseidoniales archaeon]
MTLLLWYVLVASALLTMSTVGVYLSGRWGEASWSTRLLLLVSGSVDGTLGLALLSWLGLSSATAVAGGFLLGTLSMMFVQPLLLPQRLLVWRLARENMVRRKRQSALMLAGLIIASAIITSSLVVGDSLDATVGREVQAAYGETDVLIAGFDPMTGVAVAFDEGIGARYWASLQQNTELADDLRGRQFGLTSSVSLSADSGLAEPSVSLFAHNATIDGESVWQALDPANAYRFSDIAAANEVRSTPGVAINAVAAEALEVGVGDALELGAFVTEDNQRVRTTHSVEVLAVVPNEGQGAMAGTRSPAVFLDLTAAQGLLGMDRELTRIALSFKPSLSDSAIKQHLDALEQVFNDVLTAEDIGLVWTVDDGTSSLTVSSSNGLQRLDGDDVAALRENRTVLYPDATLLEVLQVPLIELQVEGEPLLTLADATVDRLVVAEDALWHSTANGLGFERLSTNEAWIWQVDEGERMVDVAWSDHNSTVGFLSGQRMVVADTNLTDEDERFSVSFEGAPTALARGEGVWYTLVEHAGTLELLTLDDNLSTLASSNLTVPLPTTVLSFDLRVAEDALLLRVEGLLSSTYYRGALPLIDMEKINAEAWPSDSDEPIQVVEPCDGRAAAVLEAGETWCSFEHGLLRLEATTNVVDTLRLPVLSDAPGFGKLPQMVLAFGGEGATLEVEEGQVLTSARLEALGLEDGNVLAMTGVLPYAYGNDSSTMLAYNGDYTAIDGFEQLADLDAVVLGLVSLSDAEVLALAEEDDRSLLMFSGPGFSGGNTTSLDAMTAWFDQRSEAEDIHLRLAAVKLEAAEQAAASSGALSAMFLVFGTFTIAAGVLLSLTIIMLLADVRRSEVATVRALGLRRSDARALFLLEGATLAFIASGLGSVLGLGLAWIISAGFSSIFSSVDATNFVFDWTADSFLAGWIWGTLLALLILWSSALYNAQLNIVRALRGARAVIKNGVPWGVFLLQIMALGLVGLCGLSLLLSGLSSPFAYGAYLLLGSGLILLFTPLLTWELPVFFNRGRPANRWTRYAPRNTLGAVGLLFLLWTLFLAPVDPLRAQMEANELAFIVLGLLQVLAGVMVLTSLAPQAVGWLAKQRWVLRRTGPVGSVALAHPLAHPLRTAVVMGMFSITMFSVVVLAGYTEQFDTYSSDFVEEAEGEFELLLTSTRSRPIDLGEDPSTWGIDHPALDNIDAVGAVYRAPVHLEDINGERMPYLLRGVDDGFIQHGGLPLYAWDSSLGNSSEEAWIAMAAFDNIVFLDASFGLESTADGTTLVPLQFSIGDSISLIDFSNPKNTRNAVVGGFLKQSSYIFSPGVWMNAEPVETQFSGAITRMYVSVSSDAKATPDFDGSVTAAQGKTLDERRAAAELEEVLDVELAGRNINVQTVADEIMIIQSLVLAILSLFEGYLALGLLVGVAGIGVVTVRNVSERKTTIGMLRAIGFRRRHVLRLFSVEVSWVAVLGLLNGLVIGYGFHVMLYNALWKAEGAAFSFPWVSTMLLFLVAWGVVLLTTFIPVRRAAAVPPSAVLRAV